MYLIGITSVIPIQKGWSVVKKYRVTKEDGSDYFLRLSSLEQYEVRKADFENLKRVAAFDIPMCRPVSFGKCAQGVYTLQSWIDGTNVEGVLPQLSQEESYSCGYRSGKVLQKIHSLPAPDTQEEWAVRFNRKIDRNIQGIWIAAW